MLVISIQGLMSHAYSDKTYHSIKTKFHNYEHVVLQFMLNLMTHPKKFKQNVKGNPD